MLFCFDIKTPVSLLQFAAVCPACSGKQFCILWRIDPFLGNDHETNKNTTAVVRQQILSKYQYNNRGTVGNGVFCCPRCGLC
jgi:hypothetical protein